MAGNEIILTFKQIGLQIYIMSIKGLAILGSVDDTLLWITYFVVMGGNELRLV